MQFKITARIPMGATSEGKSLPAVDANQIAKDRLFLERQITCLACPSLHLERCCEPCPICPLDERRNKPWGNLPRCPRNSWTR